MQKSNSQITDDDVKMREATMNETAAVQTKTPFHGLCRSVHDFEKVSKIGQGAYGVVFKAKDLHTGKYYALKQVKMDTAECKDGMPITAMREIQLLKLLQPHENIVYLEQVVVGDKMNSIFLVFEYCEHDLSVLLDQRPHCFSESEIKCLMVQLLKGIHFMHKNFVIHRDIKLSNLLYSNTGNLKIADFGLARHFGKIFDVEHDSMDDIERREEPMTPKVVTLWYRAPELLLGGKEYSTSVDMWAVGCIFAELLLSKPLFPGKTDVQQLTMIYDLLGPPNEIIWPGFKKLPNAQNIKSQPVDSLHDKKHYLDLIHHRLKDKFRNSKISPSGLDLLQRMLTYDPQQRISAGEALDHSYFHTKPFPQTAIGMPSFQASF